MGYDGWFEFNGEELVNLSRTAQLAETLNISTLWIRASTVDWIETALSGADWEDIADAPWYDAGYPASTEFAGIVPLSVDGLDNSTLESTPQEYITDGGHSGKPRNATLPLVWNVAIIASTDRGAEYGKRWLDRRLKDTGPRVFCSGADLTYFRTPGAGAETVHRRDVRLTRGTSITRKRSNSCSATWFVTFTMTAADPFEYGEEMPQISALGGTVTGPGLDDSGDETITQTDCAVFDYSPIFDPLYPALVASPTAPDLLPEGWNIFPGMTFERFWATLNPVEPTDMMVVPVAVLSTDTEARMVRIAIWPSDSAVDDLCDPLWSVVVSYLPSSMDFYVDGEQKASYLWDGASPVVRRTDSLVYSPDAGPVQWTTFNDPVGLRVSLDIFSDSDGVEGGGDVRLALSLVAKSD